VLKNMKGKTARYLLTSYTTPEKISAVRTQGDAGRGDAETEQGQVWAHRCGDPH
jgi:hypothetical protein